LGNFCNRFLGKKNLFALAKYSERRHQYGQVVKAASTSLEKSMFIAVSVALPFCGSLFGCVVISNNKAGTAAAAKTFLEMGMPMIE